MYYIKTENGWAPWLASHKVCDNHNKLEGVYRPEDIEVVRAKLKPRIERFLAANGLSMMAKQEFFRGHSFIEPLYGAFGEKL